MSGLITSDTVMLVESRRGIGVDTYKSALDCVMQLLNNGRLGEALGGIGWGSVEHKQALEQVKEHIQGVEQAIARQAIEDEYPALCLAARHILYDNGMVRRDHQEPVAMDEVWERLKRLVSAADLAVVEAELHALGGERLEEVCCGESGGEQSVSTLADRILNMMLEEPAQ